MKIKNDYYVKIPCVSNINMTKKSELKKRLLKIPLVLPDNKQTQNYLNCIQEKNKNPDHKIIDISYSRNKTFQFRTEIGNYNMYNMYYNNDLKYYNIKSNIFISLNQDTFNLVLDYLDFYDLYKLSLTCKDLSVLFKEDIKTHKYKQLEIKDNVNKIYKSLSTRLSSGQPKIHAIYEMYKQENSLGILLDGISKIKGPYMYITALCKYFKLENIIDSDILYKFYDAFKYNVKIKWLNKISIFTRKENLYKNINFQKWLFNCRNPYYLNDFIKITGCGKEKVINMFLNGEMNGESIEYLPSIKPLLIEKLLIRNKEKEIREYIFNWSLSQYDSHYDSIDHILIGQQTLMKNISKKVRLLVNKVKKLKKGIILFQILNRLDFIKTQLFLYLLISEHKSYLIDEIYGAWIKQKSINSIVHSVIRTGINRKNIKVKKCFDMSEKEMSDILRFQILRNKSKPHCRETCKILYKWWLIWKECKE